MISLFCIFFILIYFFYSLVLSMTYSFIVPIILWKVSDYLAHTSVASLSMVFEITFFYLIGQKIQLTKSWGCHLYSKYHLPVENHQKQPFGEAYLGLFQTSVMEFSCKNSKRLLALNNLHKKASSQSFDWVLNAHLFPFQKR